MNSIGARKTSFLEFLGLCCIFSIFLDKAVRGAFAFDFYYYYFIFIAFLIALLMEKGQFALPPKWFIGGCTIIFATSFFILLTNGLLGFEYWKQVFGILFSGFVYYNVLYVFKFNIKRIFEHYLTFAFWVSLFGVADNILHILGIHITPALPIGPFLFREFSIMGEPFYLALALSPAVAYYSTYFKRTWATEKKKFIVIIACYLLTYSAIAIAGLVLCVFFSLYLNDFFNTKKNKLILLPFLTVPTLLLINLLVENISLLNARLVDTQNLFFSTDLNVGAAGTSNSSTFALYSNYIIARDSFLNDPLFGSGLGSHPLIYKETFLKYFPSVYLETFGAQNQQDANSKFLRLLGETGLIGLILFLTAYFKFYGRKSKMTNDYLKEMGAINYAIFIYILLCLIRNGNYINVGFLLFFFMYYSSWKIIHVQSKRSSAFEPKVRELSA